MFFDKNSFYLRTTVCIYITLNVITNKLIINKYNHSQRLKREDDSTNLNIVYNYGYLKLHEINSPA